jgi:hypothetical protein
MFFLKKSAVLASCLVVTIFVVHHALASNLLLGSSQEKGGEINFKISLDSVEKLAGLKIIAEYDKETITYQDITKSAETSSLLHVVNDQKPGRIVVVMAGAKGLSGQKMELMEFHFKRKKESVSKKTTLKITEVQLMSEDLKEIACPKGSIDVVLP